MANWNDPQDTRPGLNTPFGTAGAVGTARAEVLDQGLRRHMLSIYNYMTSGVLLTGVVAMLFSRGGVESPAAQVFLNGGILAWVIMLSPLAIVFAMSFGQGKFSTTTLQAMFWGFAVLMGLSLSTVFLVYTGTSIAATFFATAGALRADEAPSLSCGEGKENARGALLHPGTIKPIGAALSCGTSP